MKITVRELSGPSDVALLEPLFRNYADWLESDLGIAPETHGIDAEIRNLPQPYAPPGGALIGAELPDGSLAGCIALRHFDTTTCEVKRLFVLPGNRGLNLGGRLVAALIEKARDLGYARILLDVGDNQPAARGLYAKCGFREIEPLDHIAYPGAVFMAYDL